MLSGTAQVSPSGLSVFFVSSLFLLVCVKMVDKNKAIVVSAGKLKKLWDSQSELRSSVCERRLENTVLRPALLTVKIAQFCV
jgi:hypothetical protein